MRNWSTNTTDLKKNISAYKKWQTEQLLTYGLDEGDFLDKNYLIKNLKKLNIPADMAKYIEFLLEDKAK